MTIGFKRGAMLAAALCICPAGWAESMWTLAHSALSEPGAIKSSNGYLVQWNASVKSRSATAIEAFDAAGRTAVAIAPLQAMPEAAAISLNDVSLRAAKPAVAAALVLGNDGRKRSELIYFNWDGSLAKRVDLSAEGEVAKVEMDPEGMVWALTADGGMLVVGTDGRIARMPLHERVNAERASFGLTDSQVWIWQPLRRRMLVADRTGKTVRAYSVAVPATGSVLMRVSLRKRNRGSVASVALLSDGRAAVSVASPGDRGTRLYVSRGKSYWLTAGVAGFWVGVDGQAVVYAREKKPDSPDFEFRREALDPSGLQ